MVLVVAAYASVGAPAAATEMTKTNVRRIAKTLLIRFIYNLLGVFCIMFLFLALCAYFVN
jgi:hypothetical protein